jgi:hypothetical protein
VSVPVRLAAFGGLLAVLMLGGLGLGRALGPVGAATAAEPAMAGHAEPAAGSAVQPVGVTGLAVSEGGYTLRPLTPLVRDPGTQEWRFVVDGPDGRPVTAFDQTHERDLHLVVVRSDATAFQHLHPERTADGTWAVPLTLAGPGAYRVYADAAPAGQPARTLAVEVNVPGDVSYAGWGPATASATVDGYAVELSGDLHPDEEADLRFEVTRDGRPVELERYLGARGHLVVLREGDLGYLHVHADEQELDFAATAPSAGRYRLFLQFSADGAVHTAVMTVDADR